MTFTKTQRIAYSLFAQMVILLMLHFALLLMGAVKFLGADAFADGLPYHHVNSFANVLLHLTVLTGLLGGGVYAAASSNADHRLRDEGLLMWAARGWTLLLLLAFFAGFFGQLEGRYLLELPPILDIALALLLALFIFVVASSASSRSAVVLIWTLGMAISVVCIGLGLLPAGNFVLDRLLRALAVGLAWHVGYVLAAAALGFWLMGRFSTMTAAWLDNQSYIIAGLLTVAGVLVSLPPLYALGASDLVRLIGGIGALVVPVCYLIFASHVYKALASRNMNASLAAHWFALAVLLLLLAVGSLGAVQTVPGIQQWTIGTRLSDVQFALTALGLVAVLLGVINEAVAELRGQNRRITGLMPFWLVALGSIGAALALGGAGLTQTYMERILGVGYLETQRVLVPLYAFWVSGLALVAVGLLIYALGFIARRPEEIIQ